VELTPSSLSVAVGSAVASRITGRLVGRLDLHFYVVHPVPSWARSSARPVILGSWRSVPAIWPE
jgi:hypothetical protein